MINERKTVLRKGTRMKIMIVEDEIIIAEDIKYTLQSLGHEVTSIVASGELAIAYAEVEKPDTIFMDILLEGDVNGIEAAIIINRKINIPIIFCTSNTDLLTTEVSRTITPSTYITKPIEEWKIQSVLDEFKHFGKRAI